MNSITIIKDIFSQGVSKDTLELCCDYFYKDIVIVYKENIPQDAFENLFHRQLYHLAKNKEYELFFESVVYLVNFRENIFKLLKYFHYELIWRDYREWKIVFRIEIYDTLLSHIFPLTHNIERFKSLDFRLPIYDIYIWKHKKEIFLQFWIYHTTGDVQDVKNALSLQILSWNDLIYNLSFYVWKEKIFISNIQSWKWARDFLIIEKYSKILLYTLLKIAKENSIETIFSFSNSNHPCKYHQDNIWFKWDYNNILASIGMKESSNWYMYGKTCELNVKNINIFIQENLDKSIPVLYKYFRL